MSLSWLNVLIALFVFFQVGRDGLDMNPYQHRQVFVVRAVVALIMFDIFLCFTCDIHFFAHNS